VFNEKWYFKPLKTQFIESAPEIATAPEIETDSARRLTTKSIKLIHAAHTKATQAIDQHIVPGYEAVYVGFHEGRRQFINKGCTIKYIGKRKNYLQECMLNTGGMTHTLQLVTESKINIFFENLD
jgi:hypothetical protein